MIKANDLRLVLNAAEAIEKEFPAEAVSNCHNLRERLEELAKLANNETVGNLAMALDSLRRNTLYIKLGWNAEVEGKRGPKPLTVSDLSYPAWLRGVNDLLESKHSLHTEMLPDMDYLGMYNSGTTPAQAAAAAVKNLKQS